MAEFDSHGDVGDHDQEHSPKKKRRLSPRGHRNMFEHAEPAGLLKIPAGVVEEILAFLAFDLVVQMQNSLFDPLVFFGYFNWDVTRSPRTLFRSIINASREAQERFVLPRRQLYVLELDMDSRRRHAVQFPNGLRPFPLLHTLFAPYEDVAGVLHREDPCFPALTKIHLVVDFPRVQLKHYPVFHRSNTKTFYQLTVESVESTPEFIVPAKKFAACIGKTGATEALRLQKLDLSRCYSSFEILDYVLAISQSIKELSLWLPLAGFPTMSGIHFPNLKLFQFAVGLLTDDPGDPGGAMMQRIVKTIETWQFPELEKLFFRRIGPGFVENFASGALWNKLVTTTLKRVAFSSFSNNNEDGVALPLHWTGTDAEQLVWHKLTHLDISCETDFGPFLRQCAFPCLEDFRSRGHFEIIPNRPPFLLTGDLHTENVRRMQINGCVDVSFFTAPNNFPNLALLYVGTLLFGDADTIVLLPSLVFFRIGDCASSLLCPLVKRFNALKKLSIAHPTIRTRFDRRRLLESVSLESSDFIPVSVEYFVIQGCFLSNAFFEGPFEGLKKLVISGCSLEEMPREFAFTIPNLASLRLNASGADVDDRFFQCGDFPQLKLLSIRNSSITVENWLPMPLVVGLFVDHCPNLWLGGLIRLFPLLRVLGVLMDVGGCDCLVKEISSKDSKLVLIALQKHSYESLIRKLAPAASSKGIQVRVLRRRDRTDFWTRMEAFFNDDLDDQA